MSCATLLLAVLLITTFVSVDVRLGRLKLQVFGGRVHTHRIQSHADYMYDRAVQPSAVELTAVKGPQIYKFIPRWNLGELAVPFAWPVIFFFSWSLYRRGVAVGRKRANPDACRRCGYPLETGEGPQVCPECGMRNPPAATQPRTQAPAPPSAA